MDRSNPHLIGDDVQLAAESTLTPHRSGLSKGLLIEAHAGLDRLSPNGEWCRD
jgi:hypothetical protein